MSNGHASSELLNFSLVGSPPFEDAMPLLPIQKRPGTGQSNGPGSGPDGTADVEAKQRAQASNMKYATVVEV